MSYLQNVPIGIKALVPLAILIVALVLACTLAIVGLGQQHAALAEANQIAVERMPHLDALVWLCERVQSDVFQVSVLTLMGLPAEMIEPVQTSLEENLSELEISYGEIALRWSLDDAERELVRQMEGPLRDFAHQARQAAATVTTEPSLGAVMVRSSTVSFAAYRDVLEKLLTYERQQVNEAQQTAQEEVTVVLAALIGLAVLVASSGVAVSVWVSSRMISRPILAMTGLMGRLADGDLSIQVPMLDHRDELGAIAQAVEVFRRNAVEKERLDEQLRQSEQHYRLLFSHSPAGILHYDHELVVTDCNERLAEIMQTTREQATGFGLRRLLDLRPLNALEQALDGQEGHYEGPYEATTGPARVWVSLHTAPLYDELSQVSGGIGLVEDITARHDAEVDRERLIEELQKSLSQVKQLSGIIPICASCKKIRNDTGYWEQVDEYLRSHSEAEFSHSICPDCMRKLYPDMADDLE